MTQPEAVQPPPPYVARRTNTLAIVSLVTAFLCWPVGFVTGIVSLNQIKKTNEDGRGLAIGAIVVSSVALVTTVVVFVVVIALGGAVKSEFHQTCTVIDPSAPGTSAPCSN